jgi:peroxin-12
MQLEHDEQGKEHHAWQESGQQFPGTTKNKPIPPPPSPAATKISESMLDTALAANRIHSPLCQEPPVNPTASISGYIFCYNCILDFVKKEGVSPVTGRDCDPTNVVRPYEPRI